MQLSIHFEHHPTFTSFRIGALELHLEREPEWASSKPLELTHPSAGEIALSLGRWALLGVNHNRTRNGARKTL